MIAERLQPRAIAYEPKFDQRVGIKASYLSDQIDSYIGERLNVLLRITKYEIKNSQLFGQDLDEPFSRVIERGINYKRQVEGKDRPDKDREETELEGFLKIQKVMLNPNTELGTMILSISPKGSGDSSYQHNFYDIFTLEEENGKRFAEARRYSSALSIVEYKDKLSPLSFVGDIFSDADFLRNPIKIDNVFFENADQVHSYLHKDHKTTTVEEFEKIMKDCEKLKQEYYFTRDPITLDAIKNKADAKAGLSHYDNTYYYSDLIKLTIPLTVSQEIDYYGHQPVRTVATGCGSSGSSSRNSFDKKSIFSSPFSVSEFGLSGEEIDYEFDQDGPCKKCNAIDVKCGPCGICRACDLAIRASAKNKLN